jgi:ATP-dependent helicase IRC3
MNQLSLRPYQQQCLDTIHAKFKAGINRQLVCIATGGGKTVIFAHLIKQMGCRALILAHTNELLEQAKDKIQMLYPDLTVGIVNGVSKEFDAHVIISSVQSAVKPDNLERLLAYEPLLLIVDEAHHAASPSYSALIEKLISNKTLLVGFSATPMRTDGKSLGTIFQEIIFEKTIKDLIEEGYLCQPYGTKVLSDLDLSGLALNDKGDYSAHDLTRLMDTPELNQLVADTLLEKARDRKTIIFSCTINHAKNLASELISKGVSATYVYGQCPDRYTKIQAFRNGDIQTLVNCSLLTEGFDCPETSCIVIARPTRSSSLFQQMIGRGLRPHPTKQNCLVLDFGDRNHTLCGINSLIGIDQQETISQKRLSLKHSLPSDLHPKLKNAYYSNIDLLDNQAFSWKKGMNRRYYLSGIDGTCISIQEDACDRFSVVLHEKFGYKMIAEGLSFNYAFGVAEDFAKKNRELFILSDKDAPWCNLPATSKQIEVFKQRGYSTGIDKLTRGQASQIISTGILKRRRKNKATRTRTRVA